MGKKKEVKKNEVIKNFKDRIESLESHLWKGGLWGKEKAEVFDSLALHIIDTDKLLEVKKSFVEGLDKEGIVRMYDAKDNMMELRTLKRVVKEIEDQE